jgi:hypothetical protein
MRSYFATNAPNSRTHIAKVLAMDFIIYLIITYYLTPASSKASIAWHTAKCVVAECAWLRLGGYVVRYLGIGPSPAVGLF